jgi:type I restriction enzyme S subunit
LFPKGFSKGIIHSDVLRIRTDFKKIHPVFLLFQLKHSKKIEIQIKGVTKGAIMAGINVGLLKHIIIDQPPIELQNQFAQIVAKTEALKSQYQQSWLELEHLYGSLSQKAFRGELGI